MYQKCPICNGTGIAMTIQSSNSVCPTCQGKRIISELTGLQKLRSKILSSLANEPIDATEKELGYSAAMADVIKIIDEHTNRKVKQTAVEWLVKELDLSNDYYTMRAINKAKRMEKEYIINANRDGVNMCVKQKPFITGEEYYNKTFKTK